MASLAVLTLINNHALLIFLKTLLLKLKYINPVCICWAHIHLLVHTIKVWWTLEVLWTDFYLRSFCRIMIVFPVIPHYSFLVIFTFHVQAIEVWAIATPVPPSARILRGTVGWVGVIISIFSGEWWAAMITERITSGAWKNGIFGENFMIMCLKKWKICFTAF